MIAVDGDREDVLPGIDLHLAADTHTYGSMYVTVRNDGARESADAFILAGDLIYTDDNLTGLNKNDPQLVPIGLATGSQSNLMFTSADMLKAVGGEHKRVIPCTRIGSRPSSHRARRRQACTSWSWLSRMARRAASPEAIIIQRRTLVACPCCNLDISVMSALAVRLMKQVG